ncbi:hypothetical protein OCU04_007866 [Sclerotinia nivalis]|uniref:Uncharacterized protein n=1 Tax=Sclerotinia nivalis TaxID=352851 RepID=A0A9X0AJM7_9HELO|nr:hypothetical protein OCU04_007866 [Sclerotinia nivalis]
MSTNTMKNLNATSPPASSPQYRPLNRVKNEFRLLKIFPPANSLLTSSDPLSFAADPIQCELQYESLSVLANRSSSKISSKNSILAYLLQDIPRMRRNDGPDTDVGALINVLSHQLGSQLSMDKDSFHEFSKERKDVLHDIYRTSQQVLAGWAPDGIEMKTKPFEDWLSTWIWTPLTDDESHTEYQSLSYFALSYVWNDKPQPTLGQSNRETELMVTASGMTMREALEKINITPEELMQFVVVLVII